MQQPSLLRGLMLATLLLGPALLVACGSPAPTDEPSPAGPPQMVDLAPRQISNNRENLLIILGNNIQRGAQVAVGPKLVGRDVAGKVTWVNQGYLAVSVAAGMEPGLYTVGFTNPDGRFDKLDRVLEIRAANPTAAPAATTPATPAPTPSATATATATVEPTPVRTPSVAPTPPPPTATPTLPPPTVTPRPATPTPAPPTVRPTTPATTPPTPPPATATRPPATAPPPTTTLPAGTLAPATPPPPAATATVAPPAPTLPPRIVTAIPSPGSP